MGTTVFYATNRAPIGEAATPPWYGLDASPGHPEVLRTGTADVTMAAAPEAPRHIEELRQDKPSAGKPPAIAPAIEAWADTAIKEKHDAVLFIHGYANDFINAITRAAQLRDFYAIPRDGTAFPVALLAFSWPSDGLVMPPSTHYPADRRDAEAAGPALAAVLGQIAKVARQLRDNGRRIHLIAHSMGNWVLRHGILAYVAAGGKMLFDEALLTASDEDHDAYADNKKLGLMARVARRVTIHVYDFDVILMVAQKLTRTDRLGAQWPVRLPAPSGRDDAALRVGPVITELSDPNLTGHQYYRNNAEVRRDTIAVLGGQPQATIRGRLPDSAHDRHFVLWGATAGSVPVPSASATPLA